MLSPLQIKRILKHCEKLDATYGDAIPRRLHSEWQYNRGWMEALRLVLETDTKSIRNTILKEKE
jgi:hypothetical protein|tara:strand:- start:694 stop:885 length:192 start_codon:yes stop_codon:yes gene_type:complete